MKKLYKLERVQKSGAEIEVTKLDEIGLEPRKLERINPNQEAERLQRLGHS